MLRSIGKQSRESVESVRKKKKIGCGGKDLPKRKVLSLERKSEVVMDDEMVSGWNGWRKCHSKNWVMQNWKD